MADGMTPRWRPRPMAVSWSATDAGVAVAVGNAVAVGVGVVVAAGVSVMLLSPQPAASTARIVLPHTRQNRLSIRPSRLQESSDSSHLLPSSGGYGKPPFAARTLRRGPVPTRPLPGSN